MAGDHDLATAGRLTVRPQPPASQSDPPRGQQALGLARPRDGVLYVPPGYRPDRPAPLVLILHGAGGDAWQMLPLLTGLADTHGFIILSPDSRGRTWDVILGGYDADIRFIDRALQRVFATYAVDPAQVAIGGFSDGASYALSLGLINGDLFTHVLAFSPGFMAPTQEHDSPRFFISHGVYDDVLPIRRTSRRMVPLLKKAGYDVTYREFDGPHVVPPDIVQAAIGWFIGG